MLQGGRGHEATAESAVTRHAGGLKPTGLAMASNVHALGPRQQVLWAWL